LGVDHRTIRSAAVARLPKPHTTVKSGHATFRFYLGDSVEILRSFGPGSISAVVTSPPYNLGIRYRTYDDTLPRDRYLTWTSEWIGTTAQALAPEGSLFLNVGAKPTDPWTALDVAQAARRHLQLQNTIHWIKSIAIEKALAGARAGLADDLAVGHYKPINSRRFLHDCHEFVFHFTPGGTTPLERQAVGVKYQDQSNVGRWRTAASGVRCRGNTWFIPYETIQSREKDRPHPATFPPKLPEMCLRLHGIERLQVVADPFLGLGSTAVACAQLGVSFVGIEMDEGYLKDAVARTRAALRVS
jgi:site-specific DNA-methyltransferase (adenine-specific)